MLLVLLLLVWWQNIWSKPQFFSSIVSSGVSLCLFKSLEYNSIWMAHKFLMHHIILIVSSRRGVFRVAIGGSGSGDTNGVTIHIVIIVVFRISTEIVVAKGIIISVNFGFFVIVIDDGVVFGFAFGCRVHASGEDTVIIILERRIRFIIVGIINVVFEIVIVIVIVQRFKGSHLGHQNRIGYEYYGERVMYYTFTAPLKEPISYF